MKSFKLDPRCLLILSVIFSSFAIFVKNNLLLLFIVMLAFSYLFLLRINVRLVFKKVQGLIKILIMLCVIQSIFIPGDALISIFGFKLMSLNGLNIGINTFLRMVLIIICGCYFTSVKENQMLMGMIKLKLPYELAFATLLAIRNIQNIFTEFEQSFQALKLKGFNYAKLPLTKKFEVSVMMFQPTVFRSMIKAKKLSQSLYLRGFRMYNDRTYTTIIKWRRNDTCIILFTLIICILLGVII